MSKRSHLSGEERLAIAIKEMPNPLEDRRHNLSIYLVNDKASSNENRFEHIINPRHELTTNDIKRIPKLLHKAIMKKDKERKETFNLYIRRFNYKEEYIKISIHINPEYPQKAYIKTIFITKNVK